MTTVPQPIFIQDILHTLMPYFGQQDLARFSATCRAFHELALKRLLSEVQVDGTTKRIQFCAWVLTDVTVRASYIRKLRLSSFIDVIYLSPCNVSQIAIVLDHCRALKALDISYLDRLLNMALCPELSTSIGSLENLVDLTLDRIADLQAVAGILGHMRSQLRVLRLSAAAQKFIGQVFPIGDPASLHSIENVEVLELLWIAFPPPAMRPWPSVRRLSLGRTPLDLTRLISALPNTQHCCLMETTSKPSTGVVPAWDNLDTLRLYKQASGWPGRPVRRLILRELEVDTVIKAIDSVRGPQPLVLSMEYVSADMSMYFWRNMHTVTPTLRCLQMTLDMTDDPDHLRFMVCILV